MSRSLRHCWRHAASMLTAVACVGLIAAAHSGFGSARMGGRSLGERTVLAAADGAMDETTGALGPTGMRHAIGPFGLRRAAALPLSDEQRGRIFDGVMRIPDAPVAAVPAPE